MTSYSHIVTLSLLPGFFVLFCFCGAETPGVGDGVLHTNSVARVAFNTCYSEGHCRKRVSGDGPDSVEES